MKSDDAQADKSRYEPPWPVTSQVYGESSGGRPSRVTDIATISRRMRRCANGRKGSRRCWSLLSLTSRYLANGHRTTHLAQG